MSLLSELMDELEKDEELKKLNHLEQEKIKSQELRRLIEEVQQENGGVCDQEFYRYVDDIIRDAHNLDETSASFRGNLIAKK